MEWIALKEAAERLGLKDASALRHAIRRGRIPAEQLTKFGTTWAIREEWVNSRRRKR